jgi:hypothetical protein
MEIFIKRWRNIYEILAKSFFIQNIYEKMGILTFKFVHVTLYVNESPQNFHFWWILETKWDHLVVQIQKKKSIVSLYKSWENGKKRSKIHFLVCLSCTRRFNSSTPKYLT